MKKKLLSSLIVSTFILGVSLKSEAVEIAFSDKSKNSAPIIKFNVNAPLPMNLSFNGKIDFSPAYSNLVGSMKNTDTERWSFMANAEGNLAYNFLLFNAKTIVGDINPTLSPYVGYKQFATQYGYGGLALEKIEPTFGVSTVGGINYGLRASTNLPLGFFIYGDAGFTTLLNNGTWWEYRPDTSGKYESKNLTTPKLEVGASFNFLNLLTLKASYNYYFLYDLRTKQAFIDESSKSSIQSIDLGATFLFFSI
ncbi:MAG: hypothetical protein AABZ74_10975 [Cyanobacteriota bacterium]